jgi:transcriptional regulator with XRE-family HTH domain
MNVSQDYVSRRMSGKLPFDLDDIERVAAALGIEVSELLKTGGIDSSSWLRSGVQAARNAIGRPPRRSDLVRPGGDAWPNAA